MSWKQSDALAMGSIAAGVMLPFALLAVAYTMRAPQAEADGVFLTETVEECQVEVVEGDPSQVIVVLRRDQGPLTVVGHKTKITKISGDVERVRVAAEELHLRATQERLRALSEDVQEGNNSIHQAVIEIDVDAKVEAARIGLLTEELRALERRLETDLSGDVKDYEAVAVMLRASLESESAQATADDQHKKRKRKRKRRPC